MVTILQCKLYPTEYQDKILTANSREYVRAVNQITHDNCNNDEWKHFTSRHVKAELSGNVRDSAKQDMRSILSKYNKDRRKKPDVKLPILKRPILKWSYVGYTIRDNGILSIQCFDNDTFRMLVKADISETQYEIINSGKIGMLRVTQKNNKWIAQIAVTITDAEQNDTGVTMGIDVGIKVPAVCVTSEGKTKFCGNGRMNKFYRRKALSHKRKLGKAKKLNALRKLKDKESRWMTYQDHCTSKSIVDFAVKNHVDTINMEKLSGIRQSTSKSRKNTGYIHRWSFYRLQQFVEYKAERNGIKVVYVNPKYTSQVCPFCGKRNKAEDRTYTCSECGYTTHRDRVGAMNIMRVSAVDGNSLPA